MQKKSSSYLISLKQLFKQGVVFLFVGWMIVGCKTLWIDNQPQPIEVQQLAKSGVSWDGMFLPAYPKGRPEITILRIIIPAGQVLHKHKHPVINAGVLLKGELTVQTVDGKTLHLKAKEGIVEIVDTWHSGKNEGKEPAEIIVFYAGAQGLPITVQQPDL
jgi:quercetin dioxygenase-like cupin family protein